MILNSAKIQEIRHRKQFENLIFCTVEQLEALLNMSTTLLPFKIEILAELLIRRYLNRRAVKSELLDQFLPDKAWKSMENDFFRQIDPGISDAENPIWNSSDPLSSSCEKVFRRRLSQLFSEEDTAGFIPVYDTDSLQAFFIPFHFEKGSVQCGIFDLEGIPVSGWKSSYTLPYRCVVHCWQKTLLLPLTGESFMLPVHLAAKRCFDEHFPKYDRLRLLATGAVDQNHLKEVAVKEKKSAALGIFSDSVLLFPESVQYFPESSCEKALSTTMQLDRVFREICRIIESCSLVHPDFFYASRRLNSIEFETKHENFNRWEELLSILDNNARAINRWKSKENYLLCMMLRSSIYCHMGRTPEALDWNRKAKEYARQNHFEKHLLRLEIEELVLFQDLEKFDVIQALYHDLAGNIESLNDNELKMRYYGTMGQSHAYGTLAGISGFTKEEALRCFQKAAEYASEISPEDLAQDLNYLHLYHVLFEPGSEEEQTAYREAIAHIENGMKKCYPGVRMKNKSFLIRQKAFSAYRQLLSGHSLPDINSVQKLRLGAPRQGMTDWLFAVTNKYIGAVCAACGKTLDAENAFREAAEAIPHNNDRTDPILAFIRMTIFAEAFRSLRKEQYREVAISLLQNLKKHYSNKNLQKWNDFLTENAVFPGLSFWY